MSSDNKNDIDYVKPVIPTIESATSYIRELEDYNDKLEKAIRLVYENYRQDLDDNTYNVLREIYKDI